MTDRPNPLRLSRNIWVTTITSFLTDISSEMVLNLVPLFLANVLGVSTGVIGLIEGIAEATSSLLKGVSGWLSDRLGKRKQLAVLGYALSTVSKPLFYFVTSSAGALAVRFADRVGKGIRTAPRDALIADSSTAEQRGIAFGLHRAGDTAGAVIGLVIALLVVLATQAQSLELSRETFQTLVIIGIVPALLGVIVLAVGAREVAMKQAPTATTSTNAQLPRRFKFFLLTVIVFTLGNSSDAFIVLRAQERGLNVAGVLGMLITFNLIYSLFSSPLGALSDKIGRKRVLIGGWAIYGILYLGFAAATIATHIWIIYSLYGLYYAAFEGTSKAMIADLIAPEQRGTAYGIYHTAVGLTALPASVIAGVVWQGVGDWQGFGASAPFVLGAGLALCAALLLAWGDRAADSSAAQT